MVKVAFVGLGVMGYRMAGHLAKRGGHEVTVFNRTTAKAERWSAEYAGKSAATPKAAAEGSARLHFGVAPRLRTNALECPKIRTTRPVLFC